MSFFSWLNGKLSSSTSRRTHRPAGKSLPFRPRLEALEDRDLPSFTAPITTSLTGFGSQSPMAVGDINRDGKADLVIATPQGVSVFIGQGNGQFTPTAAFYSATGDTHITAVALADVNNDGRLDLITGNAPGDGGLFGERDSITVRLGSGKGGFGTPQTYQVFTTTEGPTSLAVADFNGDGKVDIAASDHVGELAVTLNAGKGAFLPAGQTYFIPIGTTGGGPLKVAEGDFNGDLKPDLVVASGTGAVYVLLNTGTGFTDPLAYAAGGDALSVAVADLNGDGKLDLVTANVLNNSVSVLLGNGDGTFGTAQTYAVGGASSIALGDFNMDGKVDIVTTGTEMDVLLNNGDGTFGAPQTVGPAGNEVVVADFNKDGFLDLAQLDTTVQGIDAVLNNADWSGTTGHKGHK
jgi:hypothetical protein